MFVNKVNKMAHSLFAVYLLFYKKKRSILRVVLILSFVLSVAFLTVFPKTTYIYGCDLSLYIDALLPGRSSVLAFMFGAKSKNVYFASINSAEVVVKVLPHNRELESIEQYFDGFEKYVELRAEQQSVVMCPRTTNCNLLFTKNMSHITDFAIPEIIEPLLLHYLPRADGWPVPALLNVCGNAIIEEYMGPTIEKLDLVDAYWEDHIFIAMGLLALAENFTNDHPKFSFYFTDISPYNVAFTENGTVVLVDLDNVIIVDRTSSGQPPSWYEEHVSEVFDEEEITFSKEDICSHQRSDHNYFMICRHILAKSKELNGGLLERLPSEIHKEFPSLLTHLNDCSGSSPSRSRIDAGRDLMKVLVALSEKYFSS